MRRSYSALKSYIITKNSISVLLQGQLHLFFQVYTRIKICKSDIGISYISGDLDKILQYF